MREVINESQKPLDIIVVSRLSPVANTSHLIEVCMQASMIDHMPETVYFLGIKIALLSFKIKLMFSNSFENELQVLFVLLNRVAINEEVV